MNGKPIRTCPACETLLPTGARYCCQCGIPAIPHPPKAGEGWPGPEGPTLPTRLEQLLLEELLRVDWPEAPPAAIFGSLREWMHTRLDLDSSYPIEAIVIAALDSAIDFARVHERLLARDGEAAARLGLRTAPRLRLLPPPATHGKKNGPALPHRRLE